MTTEGTPPPAPAPAGAKTFTQEELDRHVDARLARERTKFADYDELKEKATKFDQAQASANTDAQNIAAANDRAEKAEARAMRLEVAAAKGLTPAQAKRLVGKTQAELEADADELLTTFPSKPDGTPPPTPTPPPPGNKPTEDLKPAGDNPDAPADDAKSLDALAKDMFGGS